MIRYIFYRILFLPLVLFLFSACRSKSKDSKAAPPAVQSHPVKESELNTITLTEKAVERLGIETVEIKEASIGNSRVFSGEIIAMPGKTITVSAPVAGTLMTPGNGRAITPGQQVVKGQQLFRLVILPSEKDLLSVQEDVTQKQIQHDVAVEKVKRASQLFEEKAGSLRAKQEAEAELAGIAAQLRVAGSRLELLKGNTTAALADRMSTLQLQAPISGIIQQVYSSPSQVLANAAPIVDIVSLNPVWVRVPVYAGDETAINSRVSVSVRGLSDFAGSSTSVMATPVQGPQTSDPIATSINLFYEINNSKGDFRPGQKVSATLPFKGVQASLTIPYSAILYDIHGGTWVYENTEPRVFIRRRVELQRVDGNMAVLQRGPKPGTKIVTAGAAEIFGTEFGGGK
ncbi:MAG: efflux RND transporter periplasmic adaptor subunit [Chitinophagaceae bacterium]|nr:efflux RND transporter periplasmic adaptor subunit [Chitinophagaceae bacterium]